MPTGKIYQFETYDVSTDTIRRSRRWGTRDAIAKIPSARAIASSEAEIDSSALGREIAGMTEIGYMKPMHSGFQQVVGAGY